MSLKYRKLGLFLWTMLGLYLIFGGNNVLAVGVRPLLMEFDARPGDHMEFELSLMPGETAELVDLTLYEPVQELSGGLVYQLPMYPAFSATSWVTLENANVRVLPGAESKVTGTIRVPFSASGSHTVIIMVEPRPPEESTGITMQVRYAVRLSVRVDRAGIRSTAEINSLEVAPDSQGAPRISARFQNTSALDYLVSGEATIRDQDRRLVERITLRTPAGATSGNYTTRVYPGAEVLFTGNITRPLASGEYWMQVFLRYGESGQILRNETLVINPGEYVFPGFDELAAIIVSPSVAEHQLRAGERKSQIFEFESITTDPVRIEISLGEVMASYEHSLVEWLELRSQPEFVLPAGAKTRLAMTVAVPRDGLDGSYHGNAIFKAYNTVSGEFLSETVVPMNVLVGTDYQRTIQVRSLEAQTINGEGTYISVDLTNSGNVAFAPQVSAVIFDESGEFVDRVSMVLPEGVNELLPLQTQHFGSLITELQPGNYKFEVDINSGSLEILSETHQIRIVQ